jgi:hypothetical protein
MTARSFFSLWSSTIIIITVPVIESSNFQKDWKDWRSVRWRRKSGSSGVERLVVTRKLTSFGSADE